MVFGWLWAGDLEDLEEYEVQAAIVALRREGGEIAKLNGTSFLEHACCGLHNSNAHRLSVTVADWPLCTANIEVEAQELAEVDWADLRITCAIHAQVSTLCVRVCVCARVCVGTCRVDLILFLRIMI